MASATRPNPHLPITQGPKLSDELISYLRSVLTRAQEIQKNLSLINFRAPPQHWPAFLNRFAVLMSQMHALYEELRVHPGFASARAVSEYSIIHPLTVGFNPAVALRTKPILEIEQLQRQRIEKFMNMWNNGSISSASQLPTAEELEQHIAFYNKRVIQMRNILLDIMAAASAATDNLTTTTVGSTKQSNERSEDTMTIAEEMELQKTLQYGWSGRMLRLE
jgi:hypothetical protein